MFRPVPRVLNVEYTREGKWLVYGSAGDIFAVRTDGDTTRQALVVGPATERSPTVSPDGRWLAYASDENAGRWEIFVRPFPDTRTMKRQVSVDGGQAPRWSADGRELFFVDAKSDLIALPVSPGPVFKVDNPRRLFSMEPYVMAGLPYYDVSHDGKRFIVSRPAGSASQRPDELIVVQNFFEELKAKAPVKK
jgi:hypothetical protein